MVEVLHIARARFIPPSGLASPAIAAIKRAVADDFGLPTSAMSERRGTPETVHPRQLAQFIARRITGKSTIVIGRAFGIDHSTVVHNCQVVSKRLQGDTELSARADAIERRVRTLLRLERVLNHIEDPSARKIILMSKREQGELSDAETEWMIRSGGLEAA